MTDLTKDELMLLVEKAGFEHKNHIKYRGRYNKCTVSEKFEIDCFERFATLCRAPLVAEVERLAAERNAACDNAVTLVFQCNDLETELADWKARALAARKKDIKECAKVCEAPHGYFKDAKTNLECAKAIRALAASPQEQQP